MTIALSNASLDFSLNTLVLRIVFYFETFCYKCFSCYETLS